MADQSAPAPPPSASSDPAPPNRYGALTDVPGTLVGSVERTGDGWLTGVTVVLPPPGSVAAVDVRGGGPGTHETDALAPGTLVPSADAVVLTGGSAYGLVAAHGVQRWCEERGRGYAVGPGLVVPITPAAAVFDLGRGGDPAARPDADLGYAAAEAAAGGPVRTGSVGAGTGAQCHYGALKGGVGTASVRLASGVVVAALVAVNAVGSPHTADGTLHGAPWVDDPALRPGTPTEPPPPAPAAAPPAGPGAGFNTTLAVVATTADLDRAQARRAAGAGHDGLARALRPVHTLLDGDTVFAVATGAHAVRDDLVAVAAVQAAAADAVTLAVLDAVLSATGVRTDAVTLPAYRELCPSVLRGLDG